MAAVDSVEPLRQSERMDASTTAWIIRQVERGVRRRDIAHVLEINEDAVRRICRRLDLPPGKPGVKRALALPEPLPARDKLGSQFAVAVNRDRGRPITRSIIANRLLAVVDAENCQDNAALKAAWLDVAAGALELARRTPAV
jgi:hypothetical protein